MITKQTLKSIVLKSNEFSKVADNLEQTKISIKNNIKMLTLAERESNRDENGNFTRLEVQSAGDYD